MIFPRTPATQGSVTVGGDNDGTIVNVNAADGASVSVQIGKGPSPKLPSILARLVSAIADEDLSAFGRLTGDLQPAVEYKLRFNNIGPADVFVDDYRKYVAVLENAFRGVEQRNPAARQLVRRVARDHYESAIKALCSSPNPTVEARLLAAKGNAHLLVQQVVKGMSSKYAESVSEGHVDMEIVDLAVSLVVADAIVECDVLERPPSVTSA